MKDVFALKKASPALRLCIQSTRLVLSINESQLTDDTFRSQLLDRPDEILDIFRALTPQDISQWDHEQICALVDDADYDPAVAARESESGLFLDLHATLMELRSKMHQGAHGKGGPNVDQILHVPWEVLRSTSSIPTLVVPPAPVNSVISKEYVFVVAVDRSAAAARCLNAVLKLMRPTDLLRIVHFYEKPLIGENDAEPFNWCRDVIEGAQFIELKVKTTRTNCGSNS
ncbi:hypothetical protein BBO99_00008468 [Phytophthora kernoviae]|uniref:Uncharacterized protein n=2 Tax=Phytophthora kernoviae TaxID=325452 RepID=A0A3R7HDU8_9STRA|nr:hypothetical protein G195_010823 [Phytophthora kernoviae 00238/432]KAG2506633.1 hypothetical protein JM16_009117 [Phytophthora kernoviae]KAG2508573.1 hypothetical protein JM18_009157 [Phytophthora kernoviae]RLN38453.1 hypothetical protein BBI17_008414 [Phytophthora kernoviae]RLN75249.1 hypothetical protein BBO99_00008468 [Phytophthora kernoviae]